MMDIMNLLKIESQRTPQPRAEKITGIAKARRAKKKRIILERQKYVQRRKSHRRHKKTA